MSKASSVKPAIILLSGGMDSATVLALAKSQGYLCYALSFRYGQRHSAELDAADRLAKEAGVVRHEVIDLNLSQFGGSALTDDSIDVPTSEGEGIPVTYVPARNTVFLSIALAWAEVINAQDIFIGVNAVDYSGYPDCRPDFIQSFQSMANLATKAAVEGSPFEIHTPLINLTKGEIIKLGGRLGVDYYKTVTCYSADDKGLACGQCDACRLRRIGFAEAGLDDHTNYASSRV